MQYENLGYFQIFSYFLNIFKYLCNIWKCKSLTRCDFLLSICYIYWFLLLKFYCMKWKSNKNSKIFHILFDVAISLVIKLSNCLQSIICVLLTLMWFLVCLTVHSVIYTIYNFFWVYGINWIINFGNFHSVSLSSNAIAWWRTSSINIHSNVNLCSCLHSIFYILHVFLFAD